MWRPPLMHVDLDLRPPPHQSPRSRRVVQVDMGQQHGPRLLISDRL